ncbi:MAG: tripartite tricarboxylate transporter substrate binding protein [Burkholderiaceae bacterium]
MKRWTAVAAALAFAATSSWAQAPSGRPLQMLINFPAGASTDIVGRAFGEAFRAALDRPLVVMNKGGAFGTIGVSATVAAAPDGNTIGFLTSIPITLQPLLIKDARYTLADLVPICRVNDAPTTLIASPKSGFTQLSQVVEKARPAPGKLNLGVPGLNSGPHIAMIMLMESAGIDMLVIPHQGDNNAVQPLQSGELDVAVAQPSFGPLHGFKVLGVSSASRLASLPDVPTFTESGYPAVQSVSMGLFGPKGMPPDVVRTMERACELAVNNPRFQETMRNIKQTPTYADAASYAKQLQNDAAAMKAMAERLVPAK